MIDEQTKQLIHRAIDGELTRAEHVELNRILETSAEARQFHHQLSLVAELPKHVPTAEAPEEIKQNVLTEIGQTHQKTIRVSQSNPRGIGALIGNIFSPRLAYGLAAGLVIGVAVSALTLKGPVGHLDPLDVSGTLVGGKSASALERVDADSFSGGQATGRIAVDVGSGLTYVQVEVQSVLEVTVALDFDSESLVLRAFEQQSPLSSGVITGAGQARATHTGNNYYLFVLGETGKPTSPIALRIESSGVIYQRDIQL